MCHCQPYVGLINYFWGIDGPSGFSVGKSRYTFNSPRERLSKVVFLNE